VLRGKRTCSISMLPGHIGGTLARELRRGVENCRDLSSRSYGLLGASIKVRDNLAQDPAYRPTRRMSDNHELRLQPNANLALWPTRIPASVITRLSGPLRCRI
jgi:hypothetical protein